MQTKKDSKGFTLLEILIALTIFTIVAFITTTALNQTLNAEKRIHTHADEWNTLQRAIIIFKHDVQQAINRSVRGNEMHVFAPFVGESTYFEFTRGGVTNPTHQTQTNMERIAFLCDQGKLIRRRWEALDTPRRNQTQDKILLENLKQCRFDFLASNHQVLPVWHAYAVQQDQRTIALPMAVRLTIEVKNQGNMSLLLILPGGVYHGE